MRASASTVIGVVPGSSPAYLRRRTTAAGRRSAATWSSSSACSPRKIGLRDVEVGELVFARERVALQRLLRGVDEDVEVLPDEGIGLRGPPPLQLGEGLRVAASVRSSSRGCRSSTCSSSPVTPICPAPSGEKRAITCRRTWALASLFAIHGARAARGGGQRSGPDGQRPTRSRAGGQEGKGGGAGRERTASRLLTSATSPATRGPRGRTRGCSRASGSSGSRPARP